VYGKELIKTKEQLFDHCTQLLSLSMAESFCSIYKEELEKRLCKNMVK
jgi:hypothetical protein